MKKYILFLFFISCSSSKNSISDYKSDVEVSYNIWHHNDFVQDSVYGTSLNNWYAEKFHPTKNEIIVATLDTQIDLEHEALKSNIWINKNEIPNNGIDDDNNGYVDDINGWNFIGKPNGEYFRYTNFEYTKIINPKNNYRNNFINNKKDSIYYAHEYKRAQKKQDFYESYYRNWLKSLDFSLKMLPLIEKTLKDFFPSNNYTYKQLDSLYKIHKINDKTFRQRRDDEDKDLGALIFYQMISMEVGEKNIEDLIHNKNQIDSIVNRNLNLNLNYRKLINDDYTKLEKGYGNKFLNKNTHQITHNTEVSSTIIGDRKNAKGLKGFHSNIKLMPLSISVSGDEDDKDIAMAIYYAVDNGAKIINMSFGKEFSLKQEWVTEAFKYAEKHNVLLVHCSGNNRFNVDENPYYPSDYSYKDSIELVNNFINVGSISKRTDSTMVSSFSNYGKKNVDIFAPGEEIYVAQPENKYGFDSGTSLAGPMVSGTAALIWLYYPKLSVQEVKAIILESGVTVDKKVVKPGTNGELVPFSELSKTGKVLNVYNAMELAKLKSKKK